VIRPSGTPVASAGPPEPEAQTRDDQEAPGLLCRLCGLDEVPWPRAAYCSERCRRRAAYLARKHRLHGPTGRQDGGRTPKRTTR
jgi:hypothetical protein